MKGSSRSRLLVLFLAGLVCCGLYVARERSLSPTGMGLPLDDSWIHLQYARNLAEGNGLSFRQGRLVPGSTAPLWTALVSIAFLLPGPVLLWIKAMGIGFYLAGADATIRLSRELGVGSWLAALAGLLFLLTDAMVWSALSGMEIGLFVLLALWGTILHLRERQSGSVAPLSLILLAVSSLARPEGLLLVGLAVVDRWILRSPGGEAKKVTRPVLVALLCAAAVILASQIFSWIATGSPFPTTYSVKTSGLQSFLPSVRFLYDALGILFRPHPLPVLLVAAGALVLIERLGSRGDRGLLPALWVGGLPLAYSLLDSPEHPMTMGNFGRYYFPLLPFVIVLGALALDAAWRRGAASPWHFRAAAITVVLAALLGPTITDLWRGANRYALNVRNVNQSDVAMALWMQTHVPPTALVAAQDIGAVGFLTPNPLVDMTGITNPEILPYIKGPGAAGSSGGLAGLVRFLELQRPEYLMFFSRSYPGLLDLLQGGIVHRLAVETNITMAGSDLLLVKATWGESAPAQLR